MSEAFSGPTQVLLIDDDRAMLESTAQFLSLSGVLVRQYADPVAALQAYKAGSPQIIVSDIRMPGLDGMQLLRAVLAKDPAAVIILITGHGDVPLAVEAIKLGAYQFLTKPFAPEALLEHVEAAARQRERLASQTQALEQLHAPPEASVPPLSGLSDELDEREKQLIVASLTRHNGRVAAVLDELAIPRRTLNAKMQKYGILAKAYRAR